MSADRPASAAPPAAPGRIPLSGCIIAYNEADRIGDCVASLAFCDEVVVVDSGSTDGTREVAEAMGAALERTLREATVGTACRLERTDTGLEDVFIHLMSHAVDRTGVRP